MAGQQLACSCQCRTPGIMGHYNMAMAWALLDLAMTAASNRQAGRPHA